MSEIIDDIVKINVTTGLAGVGNVNFAIPCFFGLKSELTTSSSISDDGIINVGKLTDVAEHFASTTETYRMAARWFAAGGGAGILYLRTNGENPVTTITKARDKQFFYHTFFTKDVFSDHTAVLALCDWCDANTAYLWLGTVEVEVYAQDNETNILHKLLAKGSRRVSIAPRLADTVTTDATQIYAINGEAALFSRVNYNGLRTAITGEFKSPTGVIGEDLSRTQIEAVRAKKGHLFIFNKVGNNIDPCVSINTYSMSAKNEFADDVINVDAMTSAIQVASYNLFRREGKVPMTPSGEALHLAECDAVLRQYYNNGVLGAGLILNPITNERELCEFGYKIYTKPEDILTISSAQKLKREMASINLRANLARAGHSIVYDITIV